MAKKRTKKQKIKAKKRHLNNTGNLNKSSRLNKIASPNKISNSSKIASSNKINNSNKSSNIEISDTGLISINLTKNKISKIKSTTFSESQVSLLKKDLIKTLITTLIVFSILILIYLNFR